MTAMIGGGGVSTVAVAESAARWAAALGSRAWRGALVWTAFAVLAGLARFGLLDRMRAAGGPTVPPDLGGGTADVRQS